MGVWREAVIFYGIRLGRGYEIEYKMRKFLESRGVSDFENDEEEIVTLEDACLSDILECAVPEQLSYITKSVRIRAVSPYYDCDTKDKIFFLFWKGLGNVNISNQGYAKEEVLETFESFDEDEWNRVLKVIGFKPTTPMLSALPRVY